MNDFLKHFRKGYSTHNSLLLKVLAISEGDVLELGSGVFSTPLLHWYCKNQNRRLITYEDIPEYYDFAHTYQSRLHTIRFVKDWEELDTTTHRGLVFIDHGGKKSGGYRRGFDAIRFKDSADYIVLHDTEPKYNTAYGYDKMWEHFKYRYDDKGCVPETSVVSNFKELHL